MNLPEKIQSRINNFWGYGNPKSDIWFIGMEEGFHDDEQDFYARIENTYNKDIIDIVDGMQGVKAHLKWFESDSNIQRTWSKLLLLLLTLDGQKQIGNEALKKYQRSKFCRIHSNHCCLELMPLPSKTIKNGDWHYSKYPIDYLQSRDKYLQTVKPLRVQALRSLIDTHRPKVVICYSFMYLQDWKTLTRNEFVKISEHLFHNKNLNTHFFVIPHSVAHGISTVQWTVVANSIRDLIDYK